MTVYIHAYIHVHTKVLSITVDGHEEDSELVKLSFDSGG